jgi:hypothetical protein
MRLIHILGQLKKKAANCSCLCWLSVKLSVLEGLDEPWSTKRWVDEWQVSLTEAESIQVQN